MLTPSSVELGTTFVYTGMRIMNLQLQDCLRTFSRDNISANYTRRYKKSHRVDADTLSTHN